MVKDPDPLWIRLRIQQAQKHTNPDPDADPDLADSEVFTGLCSALLYKLFLYLQVPVAAVATGFPSGQFSLETRLQVGT